MDSPLPPLPPINNNTVGSVNVAVELFDLESAIAASVADDFFRSAFSESGGSFAMALAVVLAVAVAVMVVAVSKDERTNDERTNE